MREKRGFSRRHPQISQLESSARLVLIYLFTDLLSLSLLEPLSLFSISFSFYLFLTLALSFSLISYQSLSIYSVFLFSLQLSQLKFSGFSSSFSIVSYKVTPLYPLSFIFLLSQSFLLPSVTFFSSFYLILSFINSFSLSLSLQLYSLSISTLSHLLLGLSSLFLTLPLRNTTQDNSSDLRRSGKIYIQHAMNNTEGGSFQKVGDDRIKYSCIILRDGKSFKSFKKLNVFENCFKQN